MKNKHWLLLVTFLSFFPNLWVRRADLMEARNFIAAREMIESGNWIIPTLNGEYRFEKPPLPTWLVAFMMKIFGTTASEWLLRIPFALATVLLVFLMYKLIKRLTQNELLSMLSAFVLSTCFFIMKEGIVANWDVINYTFAFAMIVYLVEGLETNKNYNYVVSGLFLGMSIMSKGPVGIFGLVIPFFVAYILIYKKDKLKKNWYKILVTILIGLVVGLAWYLYMMTVERQIFLSVMNKEVDTWTEKHSASPFFYLQYFAFTGVWIFFAVASVLKFWSSKRTLKEDEKIFNFGLAWTYTSLVLLSAVKMKKQRYGVPIYITSVIPIAVMLKYYFDVKKYKLTKADDILLGVQKGLVTLLSLGTFKLYYKNRDSKDYIKKLIIASGAVVVIWFGSVNWYAVRVLKNKNSDKTIPLIEVLRKNPTSLNVYARNVGQQDIWNIGKRVIIVKDTINYPDEFLFLSKNEVESINGYDVVDTKNYYEYYDEKEIIKLVHYKKK